MLKSKLYSQDREEFGSSSEVLDAEQMHEMAVRDADREEMENEINADLATAEEAGQTVVEIQEAVVELANNVEEMNPVEVGKAIGAIEDKLDTVAEQVEEVVVDTEALATGNLAAGIRQELEAISDKIKSAWQAVKNFFKAVWEKIKQMGRSVIVWLTDGTKKAEDLLKKINKVGDIKTNLDYKSVSDRIGTKLNTISAAKLNASTVAGFATSIDLTDPAASKTLPAIASAVKSSDYTADVKISSGSTISATRITGNTIKFALVGDDKKYAGYYTATMTKAASAKAREELAKSIVGGKGIDFIKPLLEAVPGIVKAVKATNDSAGKVIMEMTKTLDMEIDKVKFDQGMFKTIWTNTVGHKSADQYSAEEKVRAVKNMQGASSKAVSDAIFGGVAMAREINSVASIVLSCYAAGKEEA